MLLSLFLELTLGHAGDENVTRPGKARRRQRRDAVTNLDGHGLYYYVPSLLKHFTTAQINALIAPRPHLALAGNLDPLTPPAGLDRVDRELRGVYASLGSAEN